MDILTLVTTSYYEYPSNFSNGTEVNGLGDVFLYMTHVVGNGFGGMLLLTIAIIMFLTLKSSGYPASKSLTATAFVCTMIAVTLMMIGVLSFTIVMMCGIITLIMALVARSEANVGL